MQEAQINMINQQIRTSDVTDKNVLQAMSTVPRAVFVPKQYSQQAYADMRVSLGEEQVMMTPEETGRLLQAVQVKSTDSILEVGTGSGYLTALLATLGKTVISIDIFPEFIETARANLATQHIINVDLQVGDASMGWRKLAPYDVIVVTGSLPQLPDAFHHDLTIGGRLFVIIGKPPVMQALLITRTGKTKWQERSLFETNIPALINASEPSKFEF